MCSASLHRVIHCVTLPNAITSVGSSKTRWPNINACFDTPAVILAHRLLATSRFAPQSAPSPWLLALGKKPPDHNWRAVESELHSTAVVEAVPRMEQSRPRAGPLSQAVVNCGPPPRCHMTCSSHTRSTTSCPPACLFATSTGCEWAWLHLKMHKL